MATSSLCLSCVSTDKSKKLNVLPSIDLPRVSGSFSPCYSVKYSKVKTIIEEVEGIVSTEDHFSLDLEPCLQTYSLVVPFLLKMGIHMYTPQIGGNSTSETMIQLSKTNFYSYRTLVRFIRTGKTDIHEMGPVEEYVLYLVRHCYAAPNQVVDISDMQEKSIDGKNYYTFEYQLTSPNYASTSFATIEIGNGRYYTLVVADNERWKS